MSDISKEIVSLIVTKDLYKAKLLISESLNQKIGLLLEEKLISYAPTIHSSNLFEDGDPNKALSPGVYPAKKKDGSGDYVYMDDGNPEIDEKESIIKPTSYSDIARSALDGTLARTSLNLFKMPGAWPKVAGAVVGLGSLWDAGSQALDTFDQFSKNKKALADAQATEAIQASKTNPQRNSSVSGTTENDLQSAANNNEYAISPNAAFAAMAMKYGTQALNMFLGNQLVSKPANWLAAYREGNVAREIYNAEIASTSAQRTAAGLPPQLPFGPSNLGASEALNRAAHTARRGALAANPEVAQPSFERFIGQDRRKSVDRMVDRYTETISSQPTQAGQTPNVATVNAAIDYGQAVKSARGTLHTPAQAAALDAQVKAEEKALLSHLPPVIRTPLTIGQSSAGAVASAIPAILAGGSALHPTWQDELRDMLFPPLTIEKADQKVKTDTDNVTRKRSTDAGTGVSNQGMVMIQSKNKRTGDHILTSPAGRQIYMDDIEKN